jgi:hypothetical protein
MSKKAGKKETKKAQNTIKLSEFFDVSEADVSKAKNVLNPPKKVKLVKKK